MAALATSFAVEMGHHEEPQISAHLLAAIPNGTYLETFHPDRDPMFYRLVGQSIAAQGRILRRAVRAGISDWNSTRTRSGNIAYNQTNETLRDETR